MFGYRYKNKELKRILFLDRVSNNEKRTLKLFFFSRKWIKNTGRLGIVGTVVHFGVSRKAVLSPRNPFGPSVESRDDDMTWGEVGAGALPCGCGLRGTSRPQTAPVDFLCYVLLPTSIACLRPAACLPALRVPTPQISNLFQCLRRPYTLDSDEIHILNRIQVSLFIIF